MLPQEAMNCFSIFEMLAKQDEERAKTNNKKAAKNEDKPEFDDHHCIAATRPFGIF